MARRPPTWEAIVQNVLLRAACGLRAGRRAQLHGRRGRPDAAQQADILFICGFGGLCMLLSSRARVRVWRAHVVRAHAHAG